jgi:5'-3' exoribonuclease 1
MEPISIQEIYERVFVYMMLIVQRVNPQKLIFISFDGVAPRAKINQSRGRRFRAVKDREKFDQLLQKLNIKDIENFQLNSISPGTEFLTDLCKFLKARVMSLYETEWRHLKVLFSDCLTPGEGEHKIMDFLRHSKRMKLFEPTQTHCVYSADADVILLTLSLNMDNMCIIREDSLKKTFTFVPLLLSRPPRPTFAVSSQFSSSSFS